MRYLAVFLLASLPLAFTSPAPADERDARAANPAVKRVAAALYNDNLKREESQKSPSLWARFLGLDARQPQLVAREIDNLPISNLATIAKEKKRDLLATSELPPGVGKRDDLLATSGLPPGVGKRDELFATSGLPPGVGKRDELFATSGLPPGVGKRGETAAFWKRLLHLEARDTVPAQPTPYFNQRDLKPITSSTEPATHLGLFGRGVGPETTHPPIPTVQKRDIFETVTLTIKKQ